MTNPDLIGFSPKFRPVLDEVQIVAPVDSAVLSRAKRVPGRK